MLKTAMGLVFFSLFILFLFNRDFAYQSVNKPELPQCQILKRQPKNLKHGKLSHT